LECSTGRCTWKARRRDSRLAHADPELAGYLRIEERELEAGALSRIPAPERVFCHPEKGSVLDHKRYAETFREALARAEITDRVRPFHDGRHSAITHEAATEAHPLRSRLERATRTSRPHSATSTSPG
jgi:hypothetical protein